MKKPIANRDRQAPIRIVAPIQNTRGGVDEALRPNRALGRLTALILMKISQRWRSEKLSKIEHRFIWDRN